jgi:DNA-binding MarR family transcriptional regulator
VDAGAPQTDTRDESFASYRRLWDQRFPAGDEYAAAVRLMRAARIVEHRLAEILSASELTMSQWTTLTMLHFSDDGALALGKISRLLGVHTTTITTAVDRLANAGLVTRGARSDDRRTVIARLTRAGRRRIARVNRTLGEARFGLSELSADEVAALSRALSSLLPPELAA